jgi:putative ABC transport system permease protein
VVIGENIRGGFIEIWGHKLRSALTLVGIVLGTFSINCMFSIVQGIRDTIGNVFETIALDGAIFISPRQLERGERDAWNLSSSGITYADVEAVRTSLVDRALVSPMGQTGRIIEHDGKRSTVEVLAVNEDYFTIRNFNIKDGRALLPSDMIGGLPVAVLGSDVARDLFGAESPVGKEIPLDGLRFQVIGILEAPSLPPGMGGGGMGNFFGQNTMFIPISTARLYLLGPEAMVGIALKAPPGGDFVQMADDAEMLLVGRHRGVRDIEVENVAEDMLREKDEVDKMLGNFNVVLGSIAGSALLVGGIGILSLMLIAVNERLFEIGIRKAVGATDSEILVQFLVESTTLSSFGAGVGTILAVVVVQLLSSQFPFGLSVSAGGLSLAAFFAVSTGLGFGLYPAFLASRKDPVESLRAA